MNHLTAYRAECIYGLDDWNMSVPVPEPESLALALAACVSLMLTFRQPIHAVVRRIGERVRV